MQQLLLYVSFLHLKYCFLCTIFDNELLARPRCYTAIIALLLVLQGNPDGGHENFIH